MKAKKINIALFKTEYCDIITNTDLASDEWVQLSEPVEVEFKLLNNKDVLGGQLAALKRREQTLDAEYQVSKDKIESERQSLLCLDNKSGE